MKNLMSNRNYFEAAMTALEFEKGEVNHLDIESYRRLVMSVGLTKSSQELRGICSDDISSHAQVLKLALETIAHYKNTTELLSGCTKRVYAIYKEFEYLDQGHLSSEELAEIQELVEIN
jgi:hypothetical protein